MEKEEIEILMLEDDANDAELIQRSLRRAFPRARVRLAED